jgi:apolipoprotein N-acyltransferase
MPWWLAGPAAFLFCAVMALFPMLAGAAFKRWQPETFWQQALLFAALIAAVDWLRSWIFTGFPWLALGYSQAATQPAGRLRPFNRRARPVPCWSPCQRCAAGTLAHRPGLYCFGRAGGFGLRQIPWTTPVGETISVALIQGNIPQEMKFRPEAFVRTLELYRELIEQNPAQLTLLPETAIPTFFDQLPPIYIDELKRCSTAARRRPHSSAR